MATTSPPDPFKVLGVNRDADSAAIKKAYRKLVLSCHPDKVVDESLKAQKQEEFHQIQQAYETIGDTDKRICYALEQRARKLREERDREFASSKSMPTKTPFAPPRHVNVKIYTAHPPHEFRSSASKHAPSKSTAQTTSHKPFSAEFPNKSWESNIPTRSKDYYEDVKSTRRAVSDEKLKRDRDDSRERRRDEMERERRRREREDDERRRRRRAEKEETDRVEARARLRREQEERDREQRDRDQRDRERSKAKRAERDRDLRRRQQEADEKFRSKTYSEEEEDTRRSRAKKFTTKENQTRDKSGSKGRERRKSSVEDVTDMPTDNTPEKYRSTLAFAACYIQDIKAKGTPKKHTVEAKFSPDFPDPERTFQRRVSTEGKQGKAETVHTMDGGSPTRDRIDPPSVPLTQQQAPPRLQKSYSVPHAMAKEPASLPRQTPRVPLGRSNTMDPEYLRSVPTDKHSNSRSSRGRTSFDDDEFSYARPRVQKYRVGTDGGIPRVYETAQYKDAYAQVSGAPFGKVKTSQPYGLSNLSTSRRYGEDELLIADYGSPSYSNYRSHHVAARS